MTPPPHLEYGLSYPVRAIESDNLLDEITDGVERISGLLRIGQPVHADGSGAAADVRRPRRARRHADDAQPQARRRHQGGPRVRPQPPADRRLPGRAEPGVDEPHRQRHRRHGWAAARSPCARGPTTSGWRWRSATRARASRRRSAAGSSSRSSRPRTSARAPASGSTSPGGSSSGAIGGEMSLESEPGDTRFTVVLPAPSARAARSEPCRADRYPLANRVMNGVRRVRAMSEGDLRTAAHDRRHRTTAWSSTSTDAAAIDASLTGGKAAALARGRTAGLAVAPGRRADHGVLRRHRCRRRRRHPPRRARGVRAGRWRPDGRSSPAARRWSRTWRRRRWPVSSSRSSASRGFDAFVDAVTAVLDSRQRAGAAEHPIAVLVQPLIEPAYGGVMFGIDPVTGRTDRRVVSAVRGGPEPLVSGEVDGSRYVLDPSNAKVLDFAANDGPTARRRPTCGGSSSCRPRSPSVYGGPQDVEWAIATDEQLWLLQSRPVTTEIRGVPRGPIYGPGPVAETFPFPLTELETDLWVPPLRDAVREAVVLAGSATAAEVAASEVVVCVDGHVAIDLRLAGEIKPKHDAAPAAEPDPGRPPPARSVAGRAAAVGAAPPGRAPPRPHRRRSRGGSAADRAHEPAADRPAAPQPGHPAGAARPRDPHRHAHRHRRQPDDRRLGGAAGAGRGAPGRPRRQGDPRPQPGRAGAHRAAGGPGARCCRRRRSR